MAIDNKIEQAMVSVCFFGIYCFMIFDFLNYLTNKVVPLSPGSCKKPFNVRSARGGGGLEGADQGAV